MLLTVCDLTFLVMVVMNFKSIKLHKGQKTALNEFCLNLCKFGYVNVKNVREYGEFAKRGCVVDVFPFVFENPVKVEFDEDIVSSIYSFDVNSCRKLDTHEVMIILPKTVKNIFKRKKTDDVPFSAEMPLDYFVDLKKGDYVVHLNYGIGRFKGFKTMKNPAGKETSYLAVEYADGEMLYVPSEDMHLIQKFIGSGGKSPKIYKLSSGQWKKVKQKTKEKIWNMAFGLLDLHAKRSVLKGYSFSKDTEWQKELENDFPYKQTPGQVKAVEDVKKDMEASYPMDRLLCGDVGYGKTEVALRAAFKAVMDNKQVALLVPTTVLAEQHYNTFVKRMEKFPVRIEMISRFVTGNKNDIIVKDLEEGKIDIIIGTSKLLFGNIKFKDLGLVIIDEEQRFGVDHKEKLKRLRFFVDILTLTATPIPRTLYMSLMAAKDMSVIETPPKERIPIQTYVTEYDTDLICKAVNSEIKRAGQVYFVHNRVYDIDVVAEKLRKILPAVRIETAHGRMPSKMLEKVILKFINKEIDVLITTTIIQLGIDIPNVNTLIVDRADNFGLSDLYQLKGRVGRFNKKAFAYFLIPKNSVLAEPAKKRLYAIQKHTELGAGFKIAMKDLMIRGAGNLLGPQQHGYIMNVGFDLYCRLLKEAVSNIKINKEKSEKKLSKLKGVSHEIKHIV